MSRGGAIIEDVSQLLKQVAEAKCLLASKCSTSTHNGLSAVDGGLLGEIEGEVLLIKESFQRLEMWMKDVENELGVVAKQMDNILEKNTTTAGRRVFDSELQNIHKNISVLREHVTGPLDQLHCNTSSVPAPCKGSVVNSLATELHSLVIPTPRFEVAEKYEEISLILSRCLLTLAIFPQDSIIEKRLLIHWWVGEGLVTPTGNHMVEDLGDRYFRDLITEGLILPVNRAHSSEVTHFKVQSWVREEVIILAMLSKAFSFDGSGALIERFSSSPRTCLTEPPTTEQYSLEQQSMLATDDFNPDNFTTCFNVDRRNLSFKKKEFMSMRNATVLQLGRWQTSAKHHIEAVSCEFLEWLACFKKLRYLSLRGISNITELPAGSIGELTDLRILDLRGCHNLESLPVEITMLKKLTYLDVSECYLLDGMPKGLGSLRDLQVLKGFVIGNSRSLRDPCQLGELARSEKLRKLSISIGRDSVDVRRDLDQLSQLGNLGSLKITWGAAAVPPSNGVSSRELPGSTDSAGMLNLSPPHLLIKLDLRCFPGKTAPEWLTSKKIPNLRKLYIRGGGLRRLDVGRELYSVEVLRLRFLMDFRMEELELLKAFPRLVAIEIHQCKGSINNINQLEVSKERLWNSVWNSVNFRFRYKLFVDASWKRWESTAGIAYIIINSYGFLCRAGAKVSKARSKYEAKLKAMKNGMKIIHQLRIDEVQVHTDSLRLYNRLTCNTLDPFDIATEHMRKCKLLLNGVSNWNAQKIDKNLNTAADKMANWARIEHCAMSFEDQSAMPDWLLEEIIKLGLKVQDQIWMPKKEQPRLPQMKHLRCFCHHPAI